MRDAMGGTVVLVIIIAFIVITLGYMAFNVNYTKAFRMKNKIISVYEDYKGECLSDCRKEISDYAKTIGYSSGNNISCTNNYKPDDDGLYCVKRVEVNKNTEDSISDNNKYYYRIITKINIDIPVIKNIFDLQYFYITGDTKAFSKE